MIKIQMTSDGSFLSWNLNDIYTLRKDFKILGRSLGTTAANNSKISKSSLEKKIIRFDSVPWQYSIEEVVCLLMMQESTKNFKSCGENINPISIICQNLSNKQISKNKQDTSLLKTLAIATHVTIQSYQADFSRHHHQMNEILIAQKSLKMQKHRVQIESGLSKRKKRRENFQNVTFQDSEKIEIKSNKLQKIKYDEKDGPNCPTKMQRLDNIDAASSNEMMTLPNSNFMIDSKKLCVHLPSSCPDTWRSLDDSTAAFFSLKGFDKCTSEQKIIELIEQSIPVNLFPKISPLTVFRSRVFRDLHKKGLYVSVAGAHKMGGDLLVYQSDPVAFHASHLIVLDRNSIYSKNNEGQFREQATKQRHLDRIAQLRLANSLKKILVIARLAPFNIKQQTEKHQQLQDYPIIYEKISRKITENDYKIKSTDDNHVDYYDFSDSDEFNDN